MKCAICGRPLSEVREQRPCPLKHGGMICGTEHCLECEHLRPEEEKGSSWCTYWHGRPMPKSRKAELEELRRRIEVKKKEIRSAYRNNRKHTAEQGEVQLMAMLRELRMMEKK